LEGFSASGTPIIADGNTFGVDASRLPKQDLEITITNPEKTPMIISGGGLRCRDPEDATKAPLDVTAFHFECMRCAWYSSCALKAESSEPIPQTGCVLERGSALYQIGAGKSARFVAELDSGQSPPAHVECQMNLSTNQGEEAVFFGIAYSDGRPN
jgi:hypothetical protein